MVLKRWIVAVLLLSAEVWLVTTIVNATLGDAPDEVTTWSAIGLLTGVAAIIGVMIYRIMRRQGGLDGN